jgi:tRNA-dihydrouridine synthase C
MAMPDQIVMAPMEGVVDPLMRELLTGLGGIDLCVTEFIRVTANGEIWSWEDYQRCREISGCENVMIGRGLLARPGLAREIKSRRQRSALMSSDWRQSLAVVRLYLERLEQTAPALVHGRVKQWLGMMRREHGEAAVLFERIKTLRETASLKEALAGH